ncbi:MAG TPA: hypothetical protein VG733_00690 [Chthoniobacteraceae bacterium]|nr:hypothetical protein [Chthoniobacteraceae bacterium]
MKKFVVIAILLLAAGGTGFLFTPAYRHLMAGRLLRAAEREAAAGHIEQADRFYRLAIKRDASDPGALRSYANFLDATGGRGVLAVRLRITQLEPADAKARLDAAETALRMRKVIIARGLLAHPSAEMRALPRYFDLLGWMAYISHDLADADAVWSGALGQDPGNKIHETNLCMVRLSSTDEKIRDEARAKLTEIALGDQPPLAALASLMVNAAQGPAEPEKFDALCSRFEALVTPDNAFYTNYLDALRRWRPGKFKKALADYCAQAKDEPYTAMTAQSWMVTAGLYEEFVAFRDSLAAPLRENFQSALLAAEALFNLKKTDALDALLKDPVWNNVTPLRMAVQERIRRAEHPQENARDKDGAAQWGAILKAAGRNDAMLAILARMAFTWGWMDEYAQTLWATADAVPSSAPDMLDNLFQYYLRARDARDAQRVLSRQLQLQPDNPELQNNFAFLSFLLGVETGRAEKMSEDLCLAHPGTALYVSTRAFGLLKAGKAAEGLQLFGKLDVKQLQGTPAGVCYGYLLAATGDKRALEYLDGAEKWAGFPEEIGMIRQARVQAGASAP